MRLLCRHSLTVMSLLGTLGYQIFKMLDDRYIMNGWTRMARSVYESLVMQLSRRKDQEDAERYIMLYVKFRRVVRLVYSKDVLFKYADVITDHLIDEAGKGAEALAHLFGQGMVLNVDEATCPPTEGTCDTCFGRRKCCSSSNGFCLYWQRCNR
ncbi:hypothetical protein LINGRAHAP2_LOCUS4527 [Linum grandiflorum]